MGGRKGEEWRALEDAGGREWVRVGEEEAGEGEMLKKGTRQGEENEKR